MHVVTINDVPKQQIKAPLFTERGRLRPAALPRGMRVQLPGRHVRQGDAQQVPHAQEHADPHRHARARPGSH